MHSKTLALALAALLSVSLVAAAPGLVEPNVPFGRKDVVPTDHPISNGRRGLVESDVPTGKRDEIPTDGPIGTAKKRSVSPYDPDAPPHRREVWPSDDPGVVSLGKKDLVEPDVPIGKRAPGSLARKGVIVAEDDGASYIGRRVVVPDDYTSWGRRDVRVDDEPTRGKRRLDGLVSLGKKDVVFDDVPMSIGKRVPAGSADSSEQS